MDEWSNELDLTQLDAILRAPVHCAWCIRGFRRVRVGVRNKEEPDPSKKGPNLVN